MSNATQQAEPSRTDRVDPGLSDLLARQVANRPELLQMRMENETIMAECRAAPRDLGEKRR